GAKEVEKFYNYFPDKAGFAKAISDVNYRNLDRTQLCNELIRQASLVGNTSPESLAGISLLEDKNTFTITTGHQLCLFTGPLYFIYKLISTVNLSNTLKAEFPEKNFVPVYWMASEDHDFEEVNHLHAFGKKIEWQSTQTGSVGSFETAELEPLLAPFLEILGKSDNAAYLAGLFKRAYIEHKNLAEATRYLVNELFGKDGVVIVDGQSPALKKQFASFFRKDVFENTPYKKVSESIASLSELKYSIQVNPREINCFYAEGPLRARLEKENDVFRVVGTQTVFTKTELEQLIDSDPVKISPNVLLRPAYQQCILPNLAYVGGPGELAYWLEYAGMFEELKLNFPVLVPRKSVYLIDAGAKQKMEKFGFAFDDLVEEEQALIKSYLEKTNKTIDLTAYKKEIEELFGKLVTEAVNVDKTLGGSVEAEKQKGINSVAGIEGKMNKAIKQRSETEINQIKTLRSKLFPEGIPQERYDNFSMYYVKWGSGFLDEIKSLLTYDLQEQGPVCLIER
ncbi:MAG: bacillithiol biosynthesis cysteine-adding enzyme BshC, partial [Bacteroidia bacterium]